MKVKEFLEAVEEGNLEWAFKAGPDVTVVAISGDELLDQDFVPLIEVFAHHKEHGRSYAKLGEKHKIKIEHLSVVSLALEFADTEESAMKPWMPFINQALRVDYERESLELEMLENAKVTSKWIRIPGVTAFDYESNDAAMSDYSLIQEWIKMLRLAQSKL